jgi:LPPG:FO 2-phospho-L-lactate transferase
VCLAAVGVETAADAVAGLYGSRSAGGILDAWLVAEEDAALVGAVEGRGIRCRAVPLWMTDAAASGAIVDAALDLAGV